MPSSEAWKDRDRIDAAWRIRSDQQDMIKFADQKVGAVLALSTVLTGFVLANIRTIVEAGMFSLVLTFLYFITMLGVLIVALRALLARRPSAREATEGFAAADDLPKVVYFGHIGERIDGEAYWSEFTSMIEHGLLRDLCHQNWELSQIARSAST